MIVHLDLNLCTPAGRAAMRAWLDATDGGDAAADRAQLLLDAALAALDRAQRLTEFAATASGSAEANDGPVLTPPGGRSVPTDAGCAGDVRTLSSQKLAGAPAPVLVSDARRAALQPTMASAEALAAEEEPIPGATPDTDPSPQGETADDAPASGAGPIDAALGDRADDAEPAPSVQEPEQAAERAEDPPAAPLNPRDWTDEDKVAAWEWAQTGMSDAEVAKVLGRDKQQVCNWLWRVRHGKGKVPELAAGASTALTLRPASAELAVRREIATDPEMRAKWQDELSQAEREKAVTKSYGYAP